MHEFTTYFDLCDPMTNRLVQWKAFVQVVKYVGKLPFELGRNFTFEDNHRRILKQYYIFQKKSMLDKLSKKELISLSYWERILMRKVIYFFSTVDG